MNPTIRQEMVSVIAKHSSTEVSAQFAVNQYLSTALAPICERFSMAVDKLNEIDGYSAQDYVDDATALTIALENLDNTIDAPVIVINQVIEDLEDDIAILDHYIEERKVHDFTDAVTEAVLVLEAQQDLTNHVRNICLESQQLVEQHANHVPAFAWI